LTPGQWKHSLKFWEEIAKTGVFRNSFQDFYFMADNIVNDKSGGEESSHACRRQNP